MSSKYMIANLPIFFLLIISTNAITLKINGKQKDYCFTKTIEQVEDTIKIFYLISSGKAEEVNVVFKDSDGKILYQDSKHQRDEYQTDILPEGDYTLCFSPKTSNQYHISFDIQKLSESGVIKDLAKDKEVKGIINGILDLEKLFNDFEKNLKFIVDRRNHHNTILRDVVSSIKRISAIKILIIILLSIFQVFIITKFFGTNKRVSTIKAGSKDLL